MSVNGVTQVQTTSYDTTYNNTAAKAAEKNTDAAATASTSFSKESAVYESSKTTSKQKSNAAIVEQMKKDLADRTAKMQNLVSDMFAKQGRTFLTANDMIKALANGELKVDSATAAQAKEDISEDGYWGVKKTSERIFDFAKALSGGDKDKMEKMLSAFEKGFKQATAAWGKDLPEISQNTYDAVQEKFTKFFNGEEA